MKVLCVYNDENPNSVSGIGSVLINLVSELQEMEDVELYARRENKEKFGLKFMEELLPNIPNFLLESGRKEKSLVQKIYYNDYDAIFSVYPSIEEYKELDCKKLLLINDVTPLINPDWFPDKWGLTPYFDNAIRESVKLADCVLAISENTRQDIIKHYGCAAEKVKTVYIGFNRKFEWNAIATGIREKHSLKDDYLLYVGTIEPRKNIKRLIEAFIKYREKSSSDMKLVLAGKVGWDDSFREYYDALGDMKENVIVTGYLGNDEIAELYHFAKAVAYVSLYEGFGLPILEGMAAGKAVICSDTSSMPEVGGDAVEYCAPEDTESIMNAMYKVLNDEQRRKDLEKRAIIQAQKFSYRKMALEVMALLSEEKHEK